MAKYQQGRERAFSAYALFFVLYLLAVILFGAWVRITGSGAGCGTHWPTCHGEIIPASPTIKTIIEYTHRLTSGLLGIFALILVGWAAARFRNHLITWAALTTLAFVIIEALIGAGIVLAELVADDDSVARAIVIAIHLVNTLILTGAATLVAWWSTGAENIKFHRPTRLTWLLLIALLGIILTSMSGAVTALGDTLFPVDPTLGEGLFARLRDDLSPANHFLIRLRILHPLIAIFAAAYIVIITWLIRLGDSSRQAERWANITLALVFTQTFIGGINILLKAPGSIQLLHLLAAQTTWIALLILTVITLTADEDSSS